MVVVDCNVLVHLLVDGEETPRARVLLGLDADWHSEAVLMAEFTQVLAAAMRAKRLSINHATIAVTQAQTIVGPGLHLADPHRAIEVAARYAVSAYDARYLIVASDLGAPLVTEDARLQKAAPTLTRSLADAVGY